MNARNLMGVQILLMMAFALAHSSVASAQVQISNARLWAAPDHTRVVFDISEPVAHKVFQLDSPHRLVIDFAQSKWAARNTQTAFTDGLVEGLRTGTKEQSGLRVVLDLKAKVRPKSFLLPPNEQYGHRLVVDLYDAQLQKNGPLKSVAAHVNSRAWTVAIDAGHGGEDGGAVGSRGTKEKDVVLSIAKRLAALVNRQPGLRAVLIRDGDYYLGLRERMRLARKHRADLFISIHADAFKNLKARGSSVYILSPKGASSEMAKWLADRENAADLVGGISLDDKDDMVASVLLDLSQTATLESSSKLATHVLTEFKQLGAMHKNSVQQAGFVVLKSPDIPSVLVETAFISNPLEERKLTSSSHQDAIARALLRGVDAYFASMRPPLPQLMQARTHTITPGDTLSALAQRYAVSLHVLRQVNNIQNADRLRIGQILQIPQPQDS